MVTEHEQLLLLRRQAERTRKGYEPWNVRAIEEQADEIEERLKYYDALHQELISMSLDRSKAGAMWGTLSRENYDVQAGVSHFLSSLYVEGLITFQEFQDVKNRLVFIPTVTQNARMQAQEEERKLNDAFQMVLQASDKDRRQEVLAEYNKLEGMRTWDKLNAWVKNCIDAGLLPKTYLAGVRGGNLLEKMLHPSQNKELKASENK